MRILPDDLANKNKSKSVKIEKILQYQRLNEESLISFQGYILV